MSPVATRLLEFHRAEPNRASFPLQEMAMENISLAEMDDAYEELLRDGLVVRSGHFVAVEPLAARTCFIITQVGMDLK